MQIIEQTKLTSHNGLQLTKSIDWTGSSLYSKVMISKRIEQILVRDKFFFQDDNS